MVDYIRKDRLLPGALEQAAASGSGSGDMEKSTYDTNDNGSVDSAEALTPSAVQHSVAISGGKVQLTNDAATPGNNKLYGTDGTGNRGWYDQPASGGDMLKSTYDTDNDGTVDSADTAASADALTSGAVRYSVEVLTGKVQLTNDVAFPGNNKVYGTDASGNRSWRDPAGDMLKIIYDNNDDGKVDEADTADALTSGAMKNSITLDAGKVQLVNDQNAPGNNKLYGTDGTGNKGWFNQSLGDMLASTYDPGSVAANVFDVDNHISGSTNKVYTATEQTKLAGVESGATADQTPGEIKTAYESNSNTNAFTDSEKTKLAGIETGATADQTAKNSIEIDADQFQLVNDTAAPGNNKLYGTDGSGAKGWYDQPSAGSGDMLKATYDTNSDGTVDSADTAASADALTAGGVQHSLTVSSSKVQLVNDTALPGNNKVYGTDGSGTRGWYSAGSGSGDMLKSTYDSNDDGKVDEADVADALTSGAMKNSITLDGGQIQLVNDQSSPGADKVYGTNSSGTKVWKDDPAGGSGNPNDPLTSRTVSGNTTATTSDYAIIVSGATSASTITLYGMAAELSTDTVKRLRIYNDTDYIVHIDCASGETLNGASSLPMGQGENVLIELRDTGAAHIVDKEWLLIEKISASAASTVDFLNGMGADEKPAFKYHLIQFEEAWASATNNHFTARFTTTAQDPTPTWDAANGDYSWYLMSANTGVIDNGSSTANQIYLTANNVFGDTATTTSFGQIELQNMGVALMPMTRGIIHNGWRTQSPVPVHSVGRREDTGGVNIYNGIQLLLSASATLTGEFRLYGRLG